MLIARIYSMWKVWDFEQAIAVSKMAFNDILLSKDYEDYNIHCDKNNCIAALGSPNVNSAKLLLAVSLPPNINAVLLPTSYRLPWTAMVFL
jgi:hypothetical protein